MVATKKKTLTARISSLEQQLKKIKTQFTPAEYEAPAATDPNAIIWHGNLSESGIPTMNGRLNFRRVIVYPSGYVKYGSEMPTDTLPPEREWGSLPQRMLDAEFWLLTGRNRRLEK